MKKKPGPSISWISEQFTKAEEQLVSGIGDIRSRMRAAVQCISGFHPDDIPDERVRRRAESFLKDLRGTYPTYKQAIEARRFATLSRLAIRFWNLIGEIREL